MILVTLFSLSFFLTISLAMPPAINKSIELIFVECDSLNVDLTSSIFLAEYKDEMFLSL